jgi:nitrile hydratase
MAKPGGWNIDASRFAREDRPPADYLRRSYYQIWLVGLERLLLERDLLRPGEIEAGQVLKPPAPIPAKLMASEVAATLRRGGPTERGASAPAHFKIGDRVRAKEIHPPTHTRLPQYVRGHVGVIDRICGCHVFPDSNAMNEGENPQWLYTVTFNGQDLWDDAPDAGVKVSVDAWESYLEAVDAN